MKKLSVIQPQYFPSHETCARLAAADVAVWADTFPFSKPGLVNRTRVKSVSGAQWLTVPVLSRGRSRQRIHEIEIDPQHQWRHNHLKSLQVNYQNSPYYFFLADSIDTLLKADYSHLNNLCLETTRFLCRRMRINVNFISSQKLPSVHDRTERVIAWLRAAGADTYVVPHAHLDLIDADAIRAAGFQVSLFHFDPPVYHQVHSTFQPGMSGLDLLFNEGEMSLFILQQSFKLEGAR